MAAHGSRGRFGRRTTKNPQLAAAFRPPHRYPVDGMPRFHHDFTFNPDGSGRVQVRWSGPGGPGAPSPAEFVRSELQQARGVDAWAEVGCTASDDELVFSAVAWFPSVRDLRFHCQGFHVNLLDFAVECADDGAVTIRSVPSATGGSPEVPKDASDAQLREVLEAERAKLRMARDFLAGMFGDLECTAVLRAPAELVEPVPGERLDPYSTRVHFAGQKLLEIVDRLLEDDTVMLRLLRNGGVTPESALALLGDQGPIRLRTAPGAAAQFDYASEVEAARAAMPDLLATFEAAAPQYEPGVPLENVRIVACRLVSEADASRDLCPDGQSQPGVQVTVAGDLPGPCLEIEDAAATAAVADDGTDLLPQDEWDRRCHFPKRTSDGRTVYAELRLGLSSSARGFQRLAGRLTCLSSHGSEACDLGFPELAADAEGQHLGAKLLRVDVEGDGDEARTTLEVQLQVARQRVLGASLETDDSSWPLEPAGYSSCNDECSLVYRHQGELPAGARFVLTLATELARTAYEFELHDVDWLGQPLRS